MKLRTQLLTLSLATVLVPWFGWKLVQELEQFLRQAQESALLASAEVMAQALPMPQQAELAYGRSAALPVRRLDQRPILDGFADDWPEPQSSLDFESGDGGTTLRVLAGEYQGQVYLYCTVRDDSRYREVPPASEAVDSGQPSDGLLVYMRSARGLVSFRIHTAAPGSFLVNSLTSGGGQLQGYWHDTQSGYTVELSLPPSSRAFDISLGVIDVYTDSFGQYRSRHAGTLEADRPVTWLTPKPINPELQRWLGAVVPGSSRAWITDLDGWVVAQTAPLPAGQPGELTWLERIIYRLVAANRTELDDERAEFVIRFQEPLMQSALNGEAARRWAQDSDNAVVRHTVAVPITVDDEVKGALVLESVSDGLLLATNRALGRLLFVTLLLTVGLAALLWWFASRLSRRVQRLSHAVSEAMDDGAHPGDLPLTGDRDELGELARNNARLLRSVTDYTGYLQKLAGRLSHELKTPLAITRSSLDNLASAQLPDEAGQYLQRAREGLDRQTAIVRAMSEASRLESAVRSAEWETVNLNDLLGHSVEGYRSVNPDRTIQLELPEEAPQWRCAPDLLVQALDKLVDNALSLTEAPDSVTVALRAKGNFCHLSVQNTGTQLPETLRDHLFDSLVSVRQPDHQNLHLGLGLYVVRLVAEAHQGTVQARDLEEGGGVVFTISLPAQ